MKALPRQLRRLAGVAVTSALLASPGLAQSFGNEWLAFVNETSTRLGPAPTAVSSFNDEIDFATGDLDRDGDADLVVARKQPNTTGGKRPNLLLMNEGGVLVDRSGLFASATDVPGDQGFLTPTNDRDVIVVDVDGDDWLDVVTTTVIGFGDPKHLNHPRVYRNLGDDAQGDWLGLRFENARIPQLFTVPGNLAVGANTCGVTAGDVTGDGAPDLYLIDYDAGGGSGSNDLNDRLLVNDGNGFFTDESQLRFSASLLASGFGTAGYIMDMNVDGFPDVVRAFAFGTSVTYHDPANPGHFNVLQSPYGGSAYHIAAGDLNRDDRPDIVISDDGFDRYLYNTGNDALGRVVWGPAKTFQFLAGSDDSIAGNNKIVDLDQDGWNDVIINDVDVDIAGCERRMHLYHNPGGAVGQQITLREERESGTSSSWLGAKGLHSADLGGAYDTAVLDLEGDGDLDLVIGRCWGTYVWTNVTQLCQADLGFGGPGGSELAVCGEELSSGQFAQVVLRNAPASSTAVLFASTSSNPTLVPGIGGTLVPLPVLASAALPTSATGEISFPLAGGLGAFSVYIQYVTLGETTPSGYGMSNAVRIDFLP